MSSLRSSSFEIDSDVLLEIVVDLFGFQFSSRLSFHSSILPIETPFRLPHMQQIPFFPPPSRSSSRPSRALFFDRRALSSPSLFRLEGIP